MFKLIGPKIFAFYDLLWVVVSCMLYWTCVDTVKPVLSGHSQKVQKWVIKTNYRLIQVKSIAEYFRPALSYHIALRPFFYLLFEWPLNTGFILY